MKEEKPPHESHLGLPCARAIMKSSSYISKDMIHVICSCSLKAKQNQKESGSGGQLTGRKVAYLFILLLLVVRCAWDNAIKNG